MQPNESTLSALNSGKLNGATQLDLQANLTEVPEAVFDLADSLEILSLNNNQLTSLPDDFKRLKKLKILFCSNNPFTELPEILGQCPALEMIGFKACQINHVPAASLPPQLRWLILTNNKIEALPESIGNCARMQKLMLAGNQLQALPERMSQLNNLELLRISANQFTKLPEWIFNLPALAWLALAGNPFNLPLEKKTLTNQSLTPVNWDQLTLNQQLGEGASGEIYHANWQQNTNHKQAVAVKVFKGEMTSDGLPESELAAAVAAGAHPCLTSTIGIVPDHPDSKQATIMALLDPSYKVLAGPPSFASCTRDVYPNGLTLSITAAHRIATQIATATAHLHQKGMIHGDLYAHNILVDDTSNCLLSDFGGAALIPADQDTDKIKQIEVRAFGILLGELIAHALPATQQAESKRLDALKALEAQCLAMTSKRPIMQQIASTLANL